MGEEPGQGKDLGATAPQSWRLTYTSPSGQFTHFEWLKACSEQDALSVANMIDWPGWTVTAWSPSGAVVSEKGS